MARISLSAGAVTQGRIVPAAFYPSRILGVTVKEAAKKDSNNFIFRGRITDGEFKGLNWSHLINEKGLDEDNGAPAAKWLMELLQACGVAIPKEGIGIDSDAFNSGDYYADVFLQPGNNYRTGDKENQATGFRPFTGTKE